VAISLVSQVVESLLLPMALLRMEANQPLLVGLPKAAINLVSQVVASPVHLLARHRVVTSPANNLVVSLLLPMALLGMEANLVARLRAATSLVNKVAADRLQPMALLKMEGNPVARLKLATNLVNKVVAGRFPTVK
jgi:hypothetical protein